MFAVTSSPVTPSPRVAACTSRPLLVGQRHGDAVDLGLAREGERLEVEVGRLPPQPLRPGPQLVLAERVVEAHHRDAVAHLLEQARRRGAHGLRRRVGRRQRGIVRLELPELDDEEVVLGVGDLGRIEHVVQLVVVDDLLAQLGGPRRPPPSGPPCRRRRRPSGGDAGAHDGVGVERVVERHRLARRHGPLRVVEADLDGSDDGS